MRSVSAHFRLRTAGREVGATCLEEVGEDVGGNEAVGSREEDVRARHCVLREETAVISGRGFGCDVCLTSGKVYPKPGCCSKYYIYVRHSSQLTILRGSFG